MAALGWLMNLDFAASGAGAPAVVDPGRGRIIYAGARAMSSCLAVLAWMLSLLR